MNTHAAASYSPKAMPRTKATPTATGAPDAAAAPAPESSLAAPAPQPDRPVRLRARGPAGAHVLDLRTTTTLDGLVAACAAALGGAPTHVSFRGDDGSALCSEEAADGGESCTGAE